MTEAEILAEIAEITTALSHIRKGGQSYQISTGGSTRNVTLADYETLRKERARLYQDLAEVQGDAGMTMTAGW